MQKSSHPRVKRLLTSIFNVKKWIDLERIRSGGRFVVDQCKTYFVPGSVKKTETFEQAKARLKLTDAELLVRQTALYRLSLLMLSIAMLIFIYTLYNLFYAHYSATILSVTVMMLALVMAFRYHFWFFQIKHKHLGCSLSDWFRQTILGTK